MDRWKEILIQDLKNVRKGYEEAGKDTAKVTEAIDHIPNLDQKAIVALLAQNELRYFAGAVDSLNYHRNAEVEAKLAVERQAE